MKSIPNISFSSNSTTSFITVPSSGLWFINILIGQTGVTGSDVIYVYKNGASMFPLLSNGLANVRYFNAVFFVRAIAGDILQLKTSGSGINFSGIDAIAYRIWD